MQNLNPKKLYLAMVFIFACISTLVAKKPEINEITVVTTTNDTVHGYIMYFNRFKSFKSLSVKVKDEATPRLYKPWDVSSFIVKANEGPLLFRTLIVDADYSPTEMIKLTISPEIKLTHDMVFAQILIKGPRSLYQYVDDSVYKTHYIIESENGQLTDLVNKQYLLNGDLIGNNQDYKKQLMLLLAHPSIPASRINGTVLKRKSILALVKDYNKAVSTQPSTYEYREERAAFKFGVLAGANLSMLKFAGPTEYLNQLRFKPSIGMNVGVSMNIILQGTHKRWSIYNDILYSNYKMETKNTTYVYYENSEWYRSVINASVNVSTLKLYSGIRYQFMGNLKTYIQLGLVNGYLFKHSMTMNQEAHFYSSSYIETLPLVTFRGYEQSSFFAAGTRYKKIGLEVRYEIGTGFSKSGGVSTIMNYGYLLLSYTF